VIRKRSAEEIVAGGRLRAHPQQPAREVRLHLNQYRDDRATLRRANVGSPPFTNDGSI
jgi:hypothetical protein